MGGETAHTEFDLTALRARVGYFTPVNHSVENLVVNFVGHLKNWEISLPIVLSTDFVLDKAGFRQPWENNSG